MTDAPTLLEFPCDFPVKVMGRDTDEFRAAARRIVARHAGEAAAATAQARPSSGGTYLALSFTVHAQSKPQLDALYRELNSDDNVMVVL